MQNFTFVADTSDTSVNSGMIYVKGKVKGFRSDSFITALIHLYRDGRQVVDVTVGKGDRNTQEVESDLEAHTYLGEALIVLSSYCDTLLVENDVVNRFNVYNQQQIDQSKQDTFNFEVARKERLKNTVELNKDNIDSFLDTVRENGTVEVYNRNNGNMEHLTYINQKYTLVDHEVSDTTFNKAAMKSYLIGQYNIKLH